ncbi:AAA family ATPase [Rhodococcus sp. NPDC127528]|uniref:AAA family ATPase n=1 Tax=unclassified Rhodococcus (in: high G+C Gram-positive bacteria) TaxID=192944 RepID=UPI00363A8EA0
MFAVLLTGPPGAGKSTVLTTLHDNLGEAGVANALLELDELERCYPPLDERLLMSHVASLACSYREAGYPLLLATATVEDDAYRDAVLAAIGADAHLLVRLAAEPETVRRRVLDREPESWSGRDELAAAAFRLATTMRALTGVDLVLSTEGRDPDRVAEELEDALRRCPAEPLQDTDPDATRTA